MEKRIDLIVTRHPGSEASWFDWHNDANNLGGDVMEYTFIVND